MHSIMFLLPKNTCVNNDININISSIGNGMRMAILNDKIKLYYSKCINQVELANQITYFTINNK
ncbi:hypothetical protein PIROE2DRAFT_12550 [Piromyces sp. E2]|nr:hypothetical protein PIROE2DRAFT_12550 [Piromyces sp. E2]|eukprot:OUM61449.1 hypothetical protein PIROE2DRAFT_12550 [Piromyces sp. E2]